MGVAGPTWAVNGPQPIAPYHGLLPAAAAPAAGVRIVVDTSQGVADLNDLPDEDGSLEAGLFRNPDGTISMRAPDGTTSVVYTPANAGRERWLNGVEVWPYPAEVPQGWDACATGSDEGTKGFGVPVPPPTFAALTIATPISCTSQQVPDQDAFKARAVATLAATESWRVARELMSGETLGGTYLADSNCALPNGNVATSPNHGLQVLEEYASQSGRLFVIHCSPMMATALLGSGFVIKDKTGVIRTITGTVVIPDQGYAGVSKPDQGVAPVSTQEWAYVSGPIDIRRSEIFTNPGTLAQALDRGIDTAATNGRPNNISYWAERYYVSIFDTAVQGAVLIDRCGSTCEVGS